MVWHQCEEEIFSFLCLDISKEVFAEYMDNAFQRPLVPPFNPYANSPQFLDWCLPGNGIGPPGIVEANLALLSYAAKFVSALSGIDTSQYAVIRSLLYECCNMKVPPYEITVAEFIDCISDLRNRLANAGLKDEGLVVPRNLGVEGKVEGNILDGDQNSHTYSRGIQELLRIAYGGANEHVPGGFFPKGANGSPWPNQPRSAEAVRRVQGADERMRTWSGRKGGQKCSGSSLSAPMVDAVIWTKD